MKAFVNIVNYERRRKIIKQQILKANENYKDLDKYFAECGENTIFLVCGESIRYLKLWNYFNTLETRLGIKVVRFSDFKPNPLYESVVSGVSLFKKTDTKQIVAVGGGSAMDVAKCIKLYSNLNEHENYLYQKIIPNDVKILAVPTTAGTGSEATRFAVIYYKGEKQSVSDLSSIPTAVLFDSSVLESLPEYQKKATMMDAFCHAVESFWSVNSTEESREYSKKAIKLILANKDAYLSNVSVGNSLMLEAANIAGKAINITQTTAGHAMCYKITELYNLSHGHAASLCVSRLWPYMLRNLDKCIDSRGKVFLNTIFYEIAFAMGTDTPEKSATMFEKILNELNLGKPQNVKTGDYEVLKNSVNPDRLKNTPVKLDSDIIDILYHEILE